MPNWVYNSITFESDDDYKAFAERYATRADGTEANQYDSFDFNKIVPMPDDLFKADDPPASTKLEAMMQHINQQPGTSDQDLIDLLYLYVQSDEYMPFFETYEDVPVLTSDGQLIAKNATARVDHTLKQNVSADAAEHAPVWLNGLRKYGFTSWYGWATANWGTKWNASETCLNDGSNSIDFSTAWSSVPDLLLKAHLQSGINFSMYAEGEEGGTVEIDFENGAMSEPEYGEIEYDEFDENGDII